MSPEQNGDPMEQTGFDFSASAADEKPDPGRTESPKIYSVTELTRKIRSLIERDFGTVWVTGEISGLRAPNSGHYYFTLKDENAVLNAVLFRQAQAKIPFRLEEGMEVVCLGRVSVYEARGQYQIILQHLEPKGIGALQLAFEQLKQKLKQEGLFDESRKKPLPFLPRKIGVVTSETGAAIRDILQILRRRYPNVDVLLVPVRVQGEGAAQEIAEAIALLNRRDDVEVMIVGRGGGSAEDLWAFNEEVVARAIFASRIPVISAVGHEIDFTIADFVADKRAPTPSAAAEIVIPRKEDLEQNVGELGRRLRQGLLITLQLKTRELGEVKSRLKDPSLRFPDWMMRVDDLKTRLGYGWNVGWERRRQHLGKLMSNLDHLSPLHILGKGYAVVQKSGGKRPVRSAKELKTGDALGLTFHEGVCEARVTKV